MLKQRVITALMMLAAFAALIGFASADVFALAVVVLVGATAWEWGRLCGLKVNIMQYGYAVLVGVVTLLALYSPLLDDAVRWVMLMGLLFWLSVLGQFYLAPTLQPINRPSVALLLLGVVLLCIAAMSLQYLRSVATFASSWLLLYAMSIVWVMDSGAYFSGKRFGKHKLAPSISPGKTWEGVVGGLLATMVLFVLVFLLGNWPDGSGFTLFLATVFSAAASVLGDLYESRIKRAIGMKDSSQMLPGHGGLLDRIDGVLAALPVFCFFWIWA